MILPDLRTAGDRIFYRHWNEQRVEAKQRVITAKAVEQHEKTRESQRLFTSFDYQDGTR